MTSDEIRSDEVRSDEIRFNEIRSDEALGLAALHRLAPEAVRHWPSIWWVGS